VDQEQSPQERARELVRLLVSDWRPTPRQILWAFRIAIVLGILIAIGYAYDITLWDWAQLLIIPAVIAAGGIWFNQQQRDRELQIAEQGSEDSALQAYLDQMGTLLLKEDLNDDKVRTLARAPTVTVLARLEGPRRNSQIMQEIFGHAQITMTLDTYSHVLPGMQHKAVNAITEMLSELLRRE
jgi:hypothetical protein